MNANGLDDVPSLVYPTTRCRAARVRPARALAAALGLVAAVGACGGTSAASDAGTDSGGTTGKDSGGECTTFTPATKETDIASAIATAKDGACFTFATGTYKFNNQLALGTGNGVTVQGAGMGKTILDFSGQVAGGDDGIYAQSVKDLTFKDFTITDTPHDAIKTLSVTGVTFDGLEVTWTGADVSKHGAYGIYPVQSKDILIQNCSISGANDSGVYVGQSSDIVVRNNEAFANVAGIEIENSFHADVHDNHAHDNTAGILAFALPNLQQEGGGYVRVYSNTIENNNTPNFGASADIVSILPAGTGSFVMACDHVEVFGNTFTGNHTGALAVISYLDAEMPITDSKYDPYPSNVYFHDNTFSGNGSLPDIKSQIGLLLATGLSAFPSGRVSDVLDDGVVDPKKPAGPNPMMFCEKEPKANAVCDLNLDMLNKSGSNFTTILSCASPTKSPFACTLPALPAVSFPGLGP